MTAALPLIPVVDARLGGPLATARAAAVQMSDLLATARLIYSPPLLEAMDRVSYVGVITAIGRRDGLRPRSISRRCSHTARSCRSIGVEGRQGSGAGSSIRSTALTISCGAFPCGASRSHTRSQGSGCGGFDRTPKPGSPTAEPIVRRLTAGGSEIRTLGPPRISSVVAPHAREAMRRDRACKLRCGGGSARFVFRGEPFHRPRLGYGLGGLRLAALLGGF